MPVAEAERLKQFWETRYQRFSLSESGWLGAGEKKNKLLYSCKTQALKAALKRLGLKHDAGFSVLDAGCGQGYFARFYQNCFPRAKYTGIDISVKAISHLKTAFPDYTFFSDNVIEWRDPRGTKFDLIQAFDILYLILDDDLVARTMRGFSSGLATNGHIVMTCVLPDETVWPNSYVKLRSRHWYEELFAEVGLAIVNERAMYYWLPDGFPGNRYIRGLLDLAGLTILYAIDRAALALKLPRLKAGIDCRMRLLTVAQR